MVAGEQDGKNLNCCDLLFEPYSLIVPEQDDKKTYLSRDLQFEISKPYNIIAPEQDDKTLIVTQPYCLLISRK